mgnify:CR=1 FL=1
MAIYTFQTVGTGVKLKTITATMPATGAAVVTVPHILFGPKIIFVEVSVLTNTTTGATIQSVNTFLGGSEFYYDYDNNNIYLRTTLLNSAAVLGKQANISVWYEA